MAVSLATLDSSITNTALPNIAAALQARPAESIWVVNAYQLAVVAALLPFAALADRLGARRVHLGGMAFFVVASLASALAWSLPALVAARALQGLGAAAMMSVNIALVRQIYPPQQLGRGVGLNALVVGVSFALGPTVASTLLALAALALAVCAEPAAGAGGLCGGLCVAAAHARRAASPSMPLAALLTALTFGAMLACLATAAQRGAGLRRAGAGAAGAGLRPRCCCAARPGMRRRCCRWTCCAGRCLRCRWPRRCAPSRRRAWPSCRCRSSSKPCCSAQPVQTGFLIAPWAIVVAAAAPLAGRLSER